MEPKTYSKDPILQEWMKGNLAQAALLAQEWVEHEPHALEAWLIRAECALMEKQPDLVLQALAQAKEINGDHPMFFRMVALGALQAQAFTAAHGAVSCARLTGMPEAILRDLNAALQRGARLSEDGEFPAPENTDPRWRALLPPMWHARRDVVKLVWGEYKGYIWFYPKYVVEPALAFAAGAGPEVWYQFPEAKEKALQMFPADILMRKEPKPEMLLAYPVVYLPAALHLRGYFPKMLGQDVSVVGTDKGWMLLLVHNYKHFCLAEKAVLAGDLKKTLKHAFEGRVRLSGPDRQLEQALPWLTSEFPFEQLGFPT